jgi:hypothetical protein
MKGIFSRGGTSDRKENVFGNSPNYMYIEYTPSPNTGKLKKKRQKKVTIRVNPLSDCSTVKGPLYTQETFFSGL